MTSSDDSIYVPPKTQSKKKGLCKLFKCSTCGSGCSTKHDLDEHKVSCKEKEKIVCDVCKSSFKNDQQLSVHFKKYHPRNGRPLECKKCGFTCSNASEEFRKHKYTCEKKHLKLCSICKEVFGDLWALNSHFKSVHTRYKIEECKICGYIAKGSNDYKRHVATHTDEKRCKYCSFEFLLVKERQIHEHKHLDKDGNVHFNCYYCEATFEEKEKYAEHFLPHYLALLKQKCQYCPRRFQSHVECARHILKLHEDELSSVEDDKLTRLERATLVAYRFDDSDLCPVIERNEDNKLAFQCKKCDKKLYGCRMLNLHNVYSLTCKSEDRLTPNSGLNKIFKKNDKSMISKEPNYEDHDSIQVNIEIDPTMDEKSSSSNDRSNLENGMTEPLEKYCYTCEKSFKEERHYKEHLQSHKGAFDCQYCGSRLSRKSVFSKHEEYCEKNRKLYTTCNECKEEFENLRELSTHLKEEHPDSKTYECECGYKATSQKHLANHTKCHNDWKRFKCEICGKGYSSKENLVKHMNAHEDEKNYECEVCGYLMRHYSSYTSHMKFHKKYKTDQEQKRFYCEQIITDLFTLRRHMINKHPDKIKIDGNYTFYKCPLCNSKERKWHDFMRHYKCHFNQKDDISSNRKGKGSNAHKIKNTTLSLFAECFKSLYDKIIRHSCKYCDRTFDSIKGCATHIVKAHKEQLVPDVENNLTFSERAFIRMYGFEKEVAPGPVRNENQELAFNCKNCGDKFYGWRLLVHHQSHSKVCKLAIETSDRMEIDKDSTEDQEDWSFENDNQGSLELTSQEISPLPLAAATYQFAAENQNVCMVIWCKKLEPDLLTLTALNSQRIFICLIEDPKAMKNKVFIPAKIGLKVMTRSVKLTDNKTAVRIIHRTDTLKYWRSSSVSSNELETKLKSYSKCDNVVNFMRFFQYG